MTESFQQQERMNPLLLLFPVALFAIVIATMLLTPGDPGEERIAVIIVIVAFALVFTALAMFALVTITVDHAGVRIAYGRTPFSSFVPVDDIESVRVTNEGWLRWGGLGYRGSRRLIRRAAILLRPGPAFELSITDGTTLTIGCSRAEEAASAIVAALEARDEAT